MLSLDFNRYKYKRKFNFKILGRKILETDSIISQAGWIEWSFACLINIFITMLILLKLFVYGEPAMHPHTPQSVDFWRHRKQADSDQNKVQNLYILSNAALY